jgi:hypothetical protein
MAISEADEDGLAAKFAVMRPLLDERGWRIYLGTEANALGYGGIAAVARASGASETTVAAGAELARDPDALAALEPGRSRRAGAGRPPAGEAQPGLAEALEEVLEDGKRGDPMSEITWSVLSLRDIARKMAGRGFTCKKDAVARMMRARGWSLRGMAKVLEGKQHPGRDCQFRHICAMIRWFRGHGHPVISVDTKKKEMLGNYGRDGQSWRPAGDPVKVRDHDFAGRDTVRIVPCGIYDVTANRGFASVGTSHDTPAFAVNAIRLWWREEGRSRYAGAGRLLITCDAGGSNACRSRLWKEELARLAEETGLTVSVCHFPPGTSKWNKIEHQMFCHVTRSWSARPLRTVEDAVAGIAATVTGKGLKCTAVTDDRDYPEGATVTDRRMRWLEKHLITRHGPHPAWNYTIRPGPPGTPEPESGPAAPDRVPAAVLNHPALTGIPAANLDAIAAALDAPFEARLQLHYRIRKGSRVRAVRSTSVNAARRLGITDHLLALLIRRHLGLPLGVIGTLLGVDPSTASHAAVLTAELLDTARVTLPDTPPATTIPRSPEQLLAHATANGVPLTIPENRYPMPKRFITRTSKTSVTRPKPPAK